VWESFQQLFRSRLKGWNSQGEKFGEFRVRNRPRTRIQPAFAGLLKKAPGQPAPVRNRLNRQWKVPEFPENGFPGKAVFSVWPYALY
jgi:hypothetical protein